MKLIAFEIEKVARKIFENRGQIFAELMINWSKIIGEHYSEITRPVKITSYKDAGQEKKMLYISVDNNSLGLEIGYQKDLIIEKIAFYFGFRAINKVKILINNE